MKKILTILILICFGIFAYFYLNNVNETMVINKMLKSVEEEIFLIDDYSIFGTHLNISGSIDSKLDGDLSLILKYKDEEIILDSNFYEEDSKIHFYTSEYNNTGILLDNLKCGKYLLLVKESNEDSIKYYSLKNNTDYGNLEYYTITKNKTNNKINIDFIDTHVLFNIEQTKLPNNIYDITIDPGHGGKDVGASGKLNNVTFYESELTLQVALLVKMDLEDKGLKVKLTRNSDEYLDAYNENGRAVIPNETKSKYSFSIHLNSFDGLMNYGGVEIYTPNDIDYTLASLIANSIANNTGIGYSKKVTDKVENGVYYTSFSTADIEESRKDMLEDDMKPYDIVEGAPYMYMIREVGGVSTHAYVDGRNTYYGLNKYYNSNQTAEPYLIELGYMNYSKDIEQIILNTRNFSSAISQSLLDYLDIS